MLLHNISSFSVLEGLLLFLCVHTVPLAVDRNQEIEDRIVSSRNLKLQRNDRHLERLGHFKSKKNFTMNFDWSNSTLMQELDEMMASLERQLNELLNDTMSLFSDDSAEGSDESFSFSWSDSASEEKPAT